MGYSRREVIAQAAAVVAAALLPRSLRAAANMEAEPAAFDNARRAERWISRSRITTEHGVTWPADPLKASEIDRAFYNGTPGIVLFLVELHRATGEKRFLEEARRGADDLAAHVSTGTDPALYTGLSGTAFVLAQFREPEYDKASRAARERVVSLGIPQSTDIISGSAGIGLTHLWFGDVGEARRHGERLLELGIAEHGGLKWPPGPRAPTLYPNFSHGTAGVAYFLATLYEQTRERRYLDGALAGVRYLDAVARRQQNGYSVFHHEPGGEELFYLSWCHGPVGTARLFYRLHRATGESSWLDRVHACAQSIIAAGVPEQRTPGYWNNISQCCGDAGVGEFFLSLQSIAPRQEYADMLRRVEARLRREATPDGDGLKWIQPEHRVRPEFVVAQTGYMQGAGGVGSFFVHAGGAKAIRLPDNPFA